MIARTPKLPIWLELFGMVRLRPMLKLKQSTSALLMRILSAQQADEINLSSALVSGRQGQTADVAEMSRAHLGVHAASDLA